MSFEAMVGAESLVTRFEGENYWTEAVEDCDLRTVQISILPVSFSDSMPLS